MAVIIVSSQAAGGSWRNDFSLPGTDSQAATDLMTQHGSLQGNATVQIVVQDDAGLAGDRQRVEAMLDQVRELPSVADVRSPYADSSAISADGTIGYATVTLDDRAEKVPTSDVAEIIDTAQAAEQDGLRVELGGDVVVAAEEGSGGAAEGAGLLAALVILVLLFGSLVAAAVPLVTALFAVGGAIGLITLASHVFTIADFTPPIMALVGLGVGVDYALLIFYRFRTELIRGAGPGRGRPHRLGRRRPDRLLRRLHGIIALLGLVVLGLGSLQGVALAVALTVLVTMVAALTLLPSLLAIFGRRIQRRVRRAAAKCRRRGPAGGRGWRRWPSAGPAPAAGPRCWSRSPALLALAAPALDMRSASPTPATTRTSSTSPSGVRPARDGFRPGLQRPAGRGSATGDPGGAPRCRGALAASAIAAAAPRSPARDGASRR